MDDLINLQMQRHTKTCKKTGKRVCRFNFSSTSMPRTMILKPLEAIDIFDDNKQNHV